MTRDDPVYRGCGRTSLVPRTTAPVFLASEGVRLVAGRGWCWLVGRESCALSSAFGCKYWRSSGISLSLFCGGRWFGDCGKYRFRDVGDLGRWSGECAFRVKVLLMVVVVVAGKMLLQMGGWWKPIISIRYYSITTSDLTYAVTSPVRRAEAASRTHQTHRIDSFHEKVQSLS